MVAHGFNCNWRARRRPSGSAGCGAMGAAPSRIGGGAFQAVAGSIWLDSMRALAAAAADLLAAPWNTPAPGRAALQPTYSSQRVLACACPAWAAACNSSKGVASAAAGALGWFWPWHMRRGGQCLANGAGARAAYQSRYLARPGAVRASGTVQRLTAVGSGLVTQPLISHHAKDLRVPGGPAPGRVQTSAGPGRGRAPCPRHAAPAIPAATPPWQHWKAQALAAPQVYLQGAAVALLAAARCIGGQAVRRLGLRGSAQPGAATAPSLRRCLSLCL